ncbi:alginate export family protein [Novosphingobium decolorationis]|uniref:Alginate export family protein n=2 Tax=Novosphingobium TaxID=165696 RepID=A0ABX8E2J1_9SPHN|nr:alginate export family protein [Novosphingobium decolorationis]QVM83347.1 alginate export family protein [Novosphingobium decolorationis]
MNVPSTARTRAALRCGLLAGMALGFSPSAGAQEAAGAGDLDLSGSVRVRYEAYDNGYRSSGARSDDALTIRTSIVAKYTRGRFRVGAEIRDSRGYAIDLDTPISSAHIDPLQVPQLYVGLDVSEQVSVTAGRMVLNFGSKRLVGDPGWRNAANAFTGARLDWQGPEGKERLSVFYTLPDKRHPDTKGEVIANAWSVDTEGFDLRFWGAFAAAQRGPVALEAYAFLLDERDDATHATRNRHLRTFGGRLQVPEAGRWDLELEAALQLGRIRTSRDDGAPSVPVRAYMAHAEAGYTLPGSLDARLSLQADMASGDKAGTARHERFDSLYGPRRSDWGPTSLYGPLGYSNVRSLGVRAQIAPSRRFDAFVDWRRLWLDSRDDAFAFTGIRDASGASGRDGGSQVQARVRYWLIPKRIKVDLGAAWLDKGAFLKRAPNVQERGDTHYGYGDIYFLF